MSHFEMSNIFRGLGDAVGLYNDVLHRLDLPGYQIDEVAYLFLDRHHLDIFTREAVREDGCLLFNTAEDHVHTLPLKTCYDVEYRFFTVPTQYLDGIDMVRVEAMQIKRGFSPLHEAETPMLVQVGAPMGAIHASFKCQTEDEYAAVVVRLRERGWEVAQKCDSTYGRFSYWSPLDAEDWLGDGARLYLKPRVNTRDMEAVGE